MEYRSREESGYMQKETIANLLKTSRRDYREYRKSHNTSVLRDAAQKLYEAMLNYGKWIYNARYTKLSQFTDDFYSNKKRIPLSEQERKDLVMSAWQMHEFAYHGQEEELGAKEYENRYSDVYSKLRFLLEHTKKENTRRERVKV